MKQSLKENFVLIAGLALPLAVALIFLIATKISVMGIEPPKTPVIFSVGVPSYPVPIWDIEIREGMVYALYKPREKDNYLTAPAFYLFDPVTKTSKVFRPPTMKQEDVNKPATYPIPDFGKISSLSRAASSPDGYVFTMQGGYRSGFFMDIFSGGDAGAYVLKKDAYTLKVSQSEPYNTQFIGWVIP